MYNKPILQKIFIQADKKFFEMAKNCTTITHRPWLEKIWKFTALKWLKMHNNIIYHGWRKF